MNTAFDANTVTAPGERFNFAQHLLDVNSTRPDKAAFVDDLGSLSYGQLDERVRRMAAGLIGAGIRREERVPPKPQNPRGKFGLSVFEDGA